MIRLLVVLLALPALAALPTREEALALAFPGAQITRREVVLGPDQVARVRALAERPQGPGIVAFEARAGGRLLGVAFFDTHRVRTQAETAMVAVAADGTLLRVEVVAFQEPAEYMAKAAWLRQFDHRRLGADLNLGRGLKPLAGSTLTATALTDAARRGLALRQVLYGSAP